MNILITGDTSLIGTYMKAYLRWLEPDASIYVYRGDNSSDTLTQLVEIADFVYHFDDTVNLVASLIGADNHPPVVSLVSWDTEQELKSYARDTDASVWAFFMPDLFQEIDFFTPEGIQLQHAHTRLVCDVHDICEEFCGYLRYSKTLGFSRHIPFCDLVETRLLTGAIEAFESGTPVPGELRAQFVHRLYQAYLTAKESQTND